MNTSKQRALIPALIAGLLLASQAQAVTAVAGDLILGFRASGGQGASSNVEVNIGPASNYYGAVPGSFVVTGLSTSDLVTTYGSGWAARTDLSWGIIGTTGVSAVGAAPARTIWASTAEVTPGTQAVPGSSYNQAAAISLQNASNNIATLYNGAPGSLSNAAAAGSPSSAIIDSGTAGSWTAQEDAVTGVSFRRFNPSVLDALGDIPSTPAVYDGTNGYSVLDLIEVRPGASTNPGTYVGSFGINTGGQIVFSTSASTFAPVPEPTVTMSALAGLLLMSLRRRR